MDRPYALVLAGGANSRFWPLREKSLLPLFGESLLRRHLRALASAGITDGLLVGGPANADLLAKEITTISSPALRVVVQPEPLGMGDAIRVALRDGGQPLERPVLVTQVHDLFAGDLLRRMLAAFAREGNRSYLAAYRSTTYFPGGYFAVEGERATALIEKPAPGQVPSDLVSIVLRLHRDPAGLLRHLERAYAAGGPDDHYERAISAQMSEHEHALVVQEERWAAIKYPWQVLDAADLLLAQLADQHLAEDVVVDPAATLRGSVQLEAGVRVFAGASIVGPAYIGRGTIIGNNALVRQACIEERCVVGFASEVARSYVGLGCWFHSNYVGDSVIGPGSSFGAGTITANLRQDHASIRSTVRGQRLDTGREKLGLICGANVSFGVQAAAMPGVKVGEGSMIGPGIVLYRDVPERRRLLLRQEVDDQPLP
jgi:bifunctional UDP-N-acetylglucosamine pyrophosphorylase/glucosamine-1-phosphate N-acetyltransferase